MKKLILVGGTMGVGKSSVCRALHQRLMPSVWLDGDWCWNLNPFEVTEETKAMAMDNIAHLLGSFLRCSQTEYVIFSWVMHQQEIIDELLSRLTGTAFTLYSYSLVCSEEILIQRLGKGYPPGAPSPRCAGAEQKEAASLSKPGYLEIGCGEAHAGGSR